MTKIMLIDATHPEETRVAVVDGRRLEEFDVEVASKHPLKGNIYLAKVTRVEPSLQAAFVEYGGNRHGFLAFSEIHPDYYRIPVADREALMREDIEEEVEEEQRQRRGRGRRRGRRPENAEGAAGAEATESGDIGAEGLDAGIEAGQDQHDDHDHDHHDDHDHDDHDHHEIDHAEDELAHDAPEHDDRDHDDREHDDHGDIAETIEPVAATQIMPLSAGHDSLRSEPVDAPAENAPVEDAPVEDATASPVEIVDFPGTTHAAYDMIGDPIDAEVPAATHGDIVEVTQPPEVIDTVGGEEASQADDADEEEEEDDSDRRRRQRHLRRYKIQEVIKRRQILLVQVTKEERGNKGAALTTYLSLAGRYCVLMPNTDRGGGISRRITSVSDRKRLKSIVDELDPPEGMAVIVRTAGMERQRSEIKRDFEYLLRLWDEIRENTLRSSAPALIYEEASLIKRSIRDLYTRDIGDIVVAGGEAFKSARTFMRMLAPGHAKRVQFYRDPSLPLFQRYQIESQIAAIHHPVVNLRSGGYIVINQTEALVAVDVNSGRSTRERNIEETALRTNLEAAEEVARQLRLRDLAGLIVIDFIDMDEGRNNAAVERRMKDALRNDRARIQIGRISSFGLLEMSRQRLHASLQEASTELCPHCHGTGRMRSVDSTALHVLRMVEEEITRNAAAGVTVFVPSAVALYILNQKRHALAQLELRRGVRIYLSADDELTPPDYRLERIKMLAPGEELPPAPEPQLIEIDFDESEDENYVEETDEAETAESDAEATDAAGEENAAAGDENGERQGRRRRRRRRGRGGRFQADEFTEQSEGAPSEGESAVGDEADAARTLPADDAAGDDGDDSEENDEGADGDDGAEADGGQGGDDQRRRRRRGRRGGRRRSRRNQDGSNQDGPNQDGQAQEGQFLADDGTAAAEADFVPGLGEQPDVPSEAAALPPAWRSENPSTEAPAAGEVEEERAERPRRQRRPRRDRDVETGTNAHSEMEQTAAVAVSAPAAPAAPATEVAAIERPVTVIEVKDSGEAVASVESEDQPKKRGWWRRLIE
ncbi:Rne/Rng family ribonuclease [Dongia sp.]|uniref:Rne/Rng family ribonuclease n=1 Tax=Dongia sp. TaxID=1977262 RepID=UPI0035AFDC15